MTTDNTQTEGERRECYHADLTLLISEDADGPAGQTTPNGVHCEGCGQTWKVMTTGGRIALESAASRGDRAVEALREIAGLPIAPNIEAKQIARAVLAEFNSGGK